MNLSYYLDLKSLCNANTKQMELFFRLAFDILAESEKITDSLFEESFIRDDDDDVLLLNHKSGQSLYRYFSVLFLERLVIELFLIFAEFRPPK
jgi:hypothetical protein